MTSLNVADGPKMLRETFCLAQAAIHELAGVGFDPDDLRDHTNRLQRLIDECDWHRPLGPDGKHRNLHTETCGCPDASS